MVTLEKVNKLKPQTRQVLDYLLLVGAITPRQAIEMHPPCFRLAPRIMELRDAFGADVIKTESAKHANGTFARYRWMGERVTVQLDLLAS